MKPPTPNRRQFLEFATAAAGSLGPIALPRAGSASPDAPTAERRYRWVRVTDRAAFAPRDGAGALVFRGKMWLLGGWNPGDKTRFPKTCNSEVWASSDGADWKLETVAPWEPRHTAGYAVHDDKMWILGGDPIQRHYQTDVWNSNDGVHWNQGEFRGEFGRIPGTQSVLSGYKSNNRNWLQQGLSGFGLEFVESA